MSNVFLLWGWVLCWVIKCLNIILLIVCNLETPACRSQQNNESGSKWRRSWNIYIVDQIRGKQMKLISTPEISRWYPCTGQAHHQDYVLKSSVKQALIFHCNSQVQLSVWSVWVYVILKVYHLWCFNACIWEVRQPKGQGLLCHVIWPKIIWPL